MLVVAADILAATNNYRRHPTTISGSKYLRNGLQADSSGSPLREKPERLAGLRTRRARARWM
jgi:hypothetical protein